MQVTLKGFDRNACQATIEINKRIKSNEILVPNIDGLKSIDVLGRGHKTSLSAQFSHGSDPLSVIALLVSNIAVSKREKIDQISVAVANPNNDKVSKEITRRIKIVDKMMKEMV